MRREKQKRKRQNGWHTPELYINGRGVALPRSPAATDDDNEVRTQKLC